MVIAQANGTDISERYGIWNILLVLNDATCNLISVRVAMHPAYDYDHPPADVAAERREEATQVASM